MEVTTLSLHEQARRFRSGELSALDLTEAHLARIAAHDAEIGAFLRVDAEGARAAAAELDDRRRDNAPLGPLAGVPIAVKDLIVTRGLETTGGSKILKGWVPPYDATAVARLRAAGAVVIGKANQDEFGMGSSNEHSGYRPAHNPWDRTRVPGGSSGGSAAAVAARFAAGSLGTDTGGSIRQPASLCGVVGVKPTYGRVSRYGCIAFASSLDQIGPLARTVDDAALLLQVIAGPDPHDQTSLPAPSPDVSAIDPELDLGGLRIGVPEEYLGEGVEAGVRQRVQAALDTLTAAGATVVPVSLPHTRYAVATYYLVATAEASSNLARFDGIRYGPRAARYDDLAEMYAKTRAEGFGPEVKRRIMLGTFALSSGYYDAYYRQAQKVRTLIRRDFDRVFEGVDLVAGPTSPVTAWKLGERTSDPLSMYLMDIFTIPASLAGLPALSLPVGADGRGLPVGLQLVGPPLNELRLLQVARGLEAHLGTMRCPFAPEEGP